jgi:hypothetical protein
VTSSLPDLEFGPEWALLELLCLGLTEPEQQQMFEDLIRSEDLNWGELMVQGLRHKMLPMLAIHTEMEDNYEFIPGYIHRHLQTILDLNKQHIVILRKTAADIVQAFHQRSIKFVFTKGITFESTIYDGDGTRVMSDIDLMIAPKDRSIVIELMSELGFQMGVVDGMKKIILPYNRKELITYKLNPDHIPSFIKKTNDAVHWFVSIDIANSLTWTRSHYEIPIEMAFENIVYQPVSCKSGIQLPTFSPHYQFIFTVLHLFREAWFERWNYHVSLAKFSDVIRLYKVHHGTLNEDGFMDIINRYKLVRPVFWVIEHLDRTLGTDMVSALGFKEEVDEEWLSSAYKTGGGMCSWKGTMRERLFCTRKFKVFSS